MSLVVVVNVCRADDRAALPIRSKMPRTDFEQEFLCLCQIFFFTGYKPDNSGSFRHARNLAADVLSGAPFIGLVGGARFWVGITISEGFVRERKAQIVFIEIRFYFSERFRAL